MRAAAVKFATMLCVAFYHLCSLTKTHRRIVFVARQDEVPIDFLLMKDYFQSLTPPWETVILAKSLRNPVLYIPELLKQIYYFATSSAIVLERSCLAVCLLTHHIKAPVVQIWHSLGNMKRFGYTALNTEEGKSTEIARLFHMHEGYDAIAISSLSFALTFAAAFNAPLDLLFEASLPRVDLLTDTRYRNHQRASLIARHPGLGARKNILYCPTFRQTVRETDREAVARLVDAIDFERCNLIYKPHPKSTLTIDDARVITLDVSTIEALCIADYVVSDYSTIIYEAGLMSLPVYLYAYDWESYEGRRGLTIDLSRDTGLLFTKNAYAITGAIEDGTFDFSEFETFVRRNVTVPRDTSCTAHMCDYVLSLVSNSS